MAYTGVYIVGSSALSWYKVGLSRNLYKRIASYKTLPFALDVKHMWLTDNCEMLERILHRTLSNEMIITNGVPSEWFHLADESLRKVYQLLDEDYNRLMPPIACNPHLTTVNRKCPKRRNRKPRKRGLEQPVHATFVRG